MIDYSKAQIPVFTTGQIENIKDQFCTLTAANKRQLLTYKFNVTSRKATVVHPQYMDFLKRKHRWKSQDLDKLAGADHMDVIKQDKEDADFPADIIFDHLVRYNTDICDIKDTGNNLKPVIANPDELARAFFAAVHQDLMVSIDTDLKTLTSKINLIRPHVKPQQLGQPQQQPNLKIG